MIKYKSFILFLIILFFQFFGFSQTKQTKIQQSRTPKSTLVYENWVYNSNIQSVQVIRADQENSFPILDLNLNDVLTISFDDLRADVRSIYFSVEYCNADWTPNRVPIMDYLSGYQEDRIVAIEQSQNTIISYTHYTFSFPNENMQPKISGNYLLKVYEDSDKEKLLFSRRIYVMKKETDVTVNIIPSFFPEKRTQHQKLDIIINSVQKISNPTMNLQLHVFQNQRQDNTKILKTPNQISSNKISYTDSKTLDFESNNEFRTVDLRSIRSTSSSVNHINRDTFINAYLHFDERITGNKYIYQVDENGGFFIRNLDFENSNLQSEYVYVHFSLKDSANIKRDIYLVGGFNNFSISTANKLTYDTLSQSWTTTQLLKQGLYDYEYITLENQKLSTDYYSGSYFETENEYQVLVYYRKPGTYWDEIISFKNINTTTKQ